MNIALLTAAGSGTRMGQDIPKQFMTIDDCPVIIYTMRPFQEHPDIDAIAVVCLDGWEKTLKAYANQFGITKLKYIFPGGASNQGSIHNGLVGLKEAGCSDEDIVLIQDGVRPLVSEDIITNNYKDSVVKRIKLATTSNMYQYSVADNIGLWATIVTGTF